MACTLDGTCQAALVLRAGSRLATRANLPAIRQVTTQQIGIFVWHFGHLVEAEVAEFASARPHAAPWPMSTASPTIIKFFQIALVV